MEEEDSETKSTHKRLSLPAKEDIDFAETSGNYKNFLRNSQENPSVDNGICKKQSSHPLGGKGGAHHGDYDDLFQESNS